MKYSVIKSFRDYKNFAVKYPIGHELEVNSQFPESRIQNLLSQGLIEEKKEETPIDDLQKPLSESSEKSKAGRKPKAEKEAEKEKEVDAEPKSEDLLSDEQKEALKKELQ